MSEDSERKVAVNKKEGNMRKNEVMKF